MFQDIQTISALRCCKNYTPSLPIKSFATGCKNVNVSLRVLNNQTKPAHKFFEKKWDHI